MGISIPRKFFFKSICYLSPSRQTGEINFFYQFLQAQSRKNRLISWKYPGIIPEISGKNLRNIFIKDPQKLFNDLEISGKNLKSILKNSINQLDSRQLWQ